ncbi:MAG: hypothetical protein PHS59_10350 [Paludibacter sp.]|nr:hypothetical protein [Paludibacter sp.]
MIDEVLVRCRPCGYVMKESELGDVCPACGLPRNVFEPYRERVSANRLFILALDIHPIAIHLSQTFVAMIPVLSIFHMIFPDFYAEIVHPVIIFSIFALPLSLVLSFFSGIMDGITRFKTLRTPLLKSKIIYSSIILILGFGMWVTSLTGQNEWITLIISFVALACAVKLGLLGKHLIDVILPGTYVRRKKKTSKYAPKGKIAPAK